MRDYRLEVCSKNPDGSFETLSVHKFRSVDVRDARTAADLWLAQMTSTLELASDVILFIGSNPVCSRPLNRRVWQTLA